MASHRKPRQRPLSGGTVRKAATLALAGAATATAFEGSSQAEPRLSPDQVKAQVDRLYEEAEAAAERYNGAKDKADRAERSLAGLRERTARQTDRLNTARNALGSLATSQYRSGALGPAVQLVLADSPQEYLDRAAILERTGDRKAAEIASVRRQLGEVGTLREEAAGQLAELRERQAELARHKQTVESKLAAAKRLLARLTAEERAAYEARNAHSGPAAAPTSPAAPAAAAGAAKAGAAARPAPAPARPAAGSSRAARAVAFAYGAIGKPYVWGATGPGSFDCSGLTQAAWRSAGVSLPRTTYTQINAGQRITKSGLAPGDLVFFYSGITHVGLYIGDGKMIHAPRPGSTVRIAPVDSMPWAGASRPA